MRRRILLLSSILTTLVVLAFAIPLAFLVRSSVEQRALKAGADEAATVAISIQGGYVADAKITDYLTTLGGRSARQTCVQKPDGTVLGEQPPGGVPNDGPPVNGKTGASSTGSVMGASAKDHATISRIKGGQIALVDVPTDKGTYIVRTYVPTNSFDGTTHRWWVLLGASSLLLILASVVAAEVVTRRLVRPLVETAATAHRLSAGDVDARAPADGPVEVAEVGIALNQLADRIGALITEERETVADLSHRLRTPLTALRLDVDGLADRQDAERLGAHVSAMERSLTAIIRTARRPRTAGLVAACDATAVVRERVGFWAPLAEDQGRRMAVELPLFAVPVRAPAEDLAAAVDALLENVIAHTPEGSGLTVRLVAQAPAAPCRLPMRARASPLPRPSGAAATAARPAWVCPSRAAAPNPRAVKCSSRRGRPVVVPSSRSGSGRPDSSGRGRSDVSAQAAHSDYQAVHWIA